MKVKMGQYKKYGFNFTNIKQTKGLWVERECVYVCEREWEKEGEWLRNRESGKTEREAEERERNKERGEGEGEKKNWEI